MAFGTKIGEVYAEVFVKINESSRKAALAGIAKEYESAFNNAFDDIDRRSTKSTNTQVNNQRRLGAETRKGLKDAEKDSRTFFQRLTHAGTQGEGTLHRVATQFRTIGTIIRGLAVGGAVIGGINLLVTALQGVVALAPVAAAGLLALPAAVAAIGTEALILKAAFKGVGKAVSDGLNPAKAKQFQKDLQALAPAARTFVKALIPALKSLPNIQQTFFSAPAVLAAEKQFRSFTAGISGALKTLVRANGNLFGKILGTATGSSGTKLTTAFLTNIATLLRNITPGLQSVTHGFQVLITKVSGEGAGRSGGLNNALKDFGHWLARINVKGIFDAAARAINALKPAAQNLWDILKGIFKAIGGDRASAAFFDTVTRFTGALSKYLNSGQGQQFVQNLFAVAKALGEIGGSTILVGLSELSFSLQVIAPLLSAIGKWARDNPDSFKKVAGAILIVVAAWKIYKTTVTAVRSAQELLDISLAANPIGAIVVGILAVAAAYAFLFTHLDKVRKFLAGPWGIAIQIATVVLLPFIGIPLVIIANWSRIINFFTGPLQRSFTILGDAFIHAGAVIVGWTKVAVATVIRWWTDVWRFFVVTLPGAAKVLWGALVHFGAIIVSNVMAVVHAILTAWNGVWRFFVVTLPGAAKVLWAALVHWGAFIVSNAIAVVHAMISTWTTIWRFFVVTLPGAAKFLWSQFVHWWRLISGETGRLTSDIVRAFTGVLRFFAGAVYGGLKKLASFAAGIWHTMSNAVGAFTSGVVKAFSGMVNTIKTVWAKIQGYVGGPIKWVVQHVYNEGIARLWNAVSGVVGHVLGTLGNIKLNFATGGPVIANKGGGARAAFATGGHIRGPGGPTQDLIPAMLSNGEYVIKADTVKKLGTSFFDALNAGPGGGNAPFAYGDTNGVIMTSRQHFASGGAPGGTTTGGNANYAGNLTQWLEGGARITQNGKMVKALHGQSATQVLGWLKSIAGRVPYRLGANGPGAFDCSSLVGSVWARLVGQPPNKRYFVTGESENSFLLHHGFKKGVRVKDSLLVGQNGEHTVGVLDGHRFEAAHTGTKMRFDDGATNALNMPQKYWMPTGGGGSLLSGVLGFIENLAGKGLQYLSKPIMWLLGRIPGVKNFKTGKLGATVAGTGKGGMFPTMIGHMANAITHAADHAEAAAEAALASAGSGGSPSNLKLGHGKFNAWAAQASRFVDIPASWLPGLLRIMMGESGGNPNAVNRTDSNARAGHPSQGLMQLIPSTYAANVPAQIRGWGIRNPVANLAAAVNYIHRKYGSVYNTPWFHGQTFYNEGGPVIQPTLFDQGGVLSPGYTLALNNTGHNEYVSTGEGGVQDLHVHFMDEHFVARVDDRIAKNNNDMIKYIITRHS